MRSPRLRGLRALAALLLLSSSFRAFAADDLSLGQKVDKLFAKWDSLDAPGAAVIVIMDGLVVYRKGFGCVLALQRDGGGTVTGFAISTGRVLNLKFTKLGS